MPTTNYYNLNQTCAVHEIMLVGIGGICLRNIFIVVVGIFVNLSS